MLIKRGREWEINQREVTDEALFLNRRSFVKSITAGAILAPSMVGFGSNANAKKKKMEIDPTASLYPVRRNDRYKVKRAISDEYDATTYNNFYEFGSHKSIYRAAEALKTRPWTISIDGLVEKKQRIDFDTLITVSYTHLTLPTNREV